MGFQKDPQGSGQDYNGTNCDIETLSSQSYIKSKKYRFIE